MTNWDRWQSQHDVLVEEALAELLADEGYEPQSPDALQMAAELRAGPSTPRAVARDVFASFGEVIRRTAQPIGPVEDDEEGAIHIPLGWTPPPNRTIERTENPLLTRWLIEHLDEWR